MSHPVADSRHRLPRTRSRWLILGALSLAIASVLALSVTFANRPPSSPSSPPPASSSFVAVGPSATPAVTSTVPPPSDPSVEPPGESPTPAPGIVAKRIRIARLNIDLPIVEGDGIDAPMNKAAHYPDTAWPDEGSNIYIYAHAQKGMFLSLWDVEVGDEVILDLVDGTTRTYRVSEIFPKAAWDAMYFLDPTPRERLTLQTSTSYHATSPRFVVIAVPVAAQ